jgi:hypothetical protein
MVTNYPVASHDGLTSATTETHTDSVGVLDRVRQIFCGLHGHDTFMHFEQDRMSLRCVSCGHETPGWELNEAPPTVTIRGDVQRHVLRPQPHLVRERRIA